MQLHRCVRWQWVQRGSLVQRRRQVKNISASSDLSVYADEIPWAWTSFRTTHKFVYVQRIFHLFRYFVYKRRSSRCRQRCCSYLCLETRRLRQRRMFRNATSSRPSFQSYHVIFHCPALGVAVSPRRYTLALTNTGKDVLDSQSRENSGTNVSNAMALRLDSSSVASSVLQSS